MQLDREAFCKRLHGLTKREIYSVCNQTATRYEDMDRRERNKRPKRRGMTEVQYDFRSDVNFIGRLLHYVVHHNAFAFGTSDQEKRWFVEIKENMKPDQPVVA